MKHYSVSYRIDGYYQAFVCVPARNKYEAYDRAFYEAIPHKHDGHLPYSAWVTSVTYNNGNVHYFNTCEGLPY